MLVEEFHDAIDHSESSIRLLKRTNLLNFLNFNIDNVREVQSLIERGAPLNCESCHPLHNSIQLHRSNGTFELI